MIVMYHRIADEKGSLHPKVFEEQVKFAKKLNIFLTFDDGLKEHYTIAFPILKKHHMKGLFYIITNFSNQLSTIHKIWMIQNNADDLIKRFNITDNQYLDEQRYKRYPIKLANLKDFLCKNPNIVDEIFNERYNEQAEIERLYMNWDDIKEMHELGMEFGSHSHTHPLAMSELSYDKQKVEIKKSTEILDKKVEKPISFCYPNGSFNDNSIKLVKEYGYQWAVTDRNTNRFYLGRIDTIDL